MIEKQLKDHLIDSHQIFIINKSNYHNIDVNNYFLLKGKGFKIIKFIFYCSFKRYIYF
jgi:hypothetical protein